MLKVYEEGGMIMLDDYRVYSFCDVLEITRGVRVCS